MCVTEEGKSGTVWVPVPKPLQDQLCMTDQAAKALAEKIIII